MNSGQPKKAQAPICSRCKRECGQTRCVIADLWVCGDCVYRDEHPTASPVSLAEPPKFRRGGRRQHERLFDVSVQSFDPPGSYS